MVKVAAIFVAALALSAVGFSAYNNFSATKAVASASIRSAFQEWKVKYAKTYKSPKEEAYRLSVFNANFLKVAKHTDSSFKVGLNLFADLTEQEFLAKYTGLNSMPVRNAGVKVGNLPTKSVSQQPTTVDWRQQGAVNAVQNQGQCGSCWAFSAVASFEGVAKIAGYQLYKFSEQQLVDCSTAEGNQGCNGGLMDQAFQYVKKVGGLESETSYPYKGVDQKCKFNSASLLPPQVASWVDVPKDNCAALLTAIALNPTSVAIAANAIQFYVTGVFSSKFCGTGLNHGVTAVGYGVDSKTTKPYWLVRNSWGASWGENGYILMDRTIQPSTGICGICMQASYPVVPAPASE
jgi:KDEL-tailed cysteine endopeptidase